MQSYGGVVVRARKRKKWSQRKLSQVTGLSRSFISDIEHGRSMGTVRTWSKLARSLGFSLDELFLNHPQREQERED